MSSESQPEKEASSSSKGRANLPFEPKKSRKKPAKTSPSPKVEKKEETEKKPVSRSEMAVPAVVSQRMARRMALFCGVPTFLGMLTFVASYVVVSHHWIELPNVVVVLLSMGFFGLGVLGLTYGVLSASWDEERVGSKLGWSEFKTNWGRMTSAWRSAGQKD